MNTVMQHSNTRSRLQEFSGIKAGYHEDFKTMKDHEIASLKGNYEKFLKNT